MTINFAGNFRLYDYRPWASDFSDYETRSPFLEGGFLIFTENFSENYRKFGGNLPKNGSKIAHFRPWAAWRLRFSAPADLENRLQGAFLGVLGVAVAAFGGLVILG